MKRFMKILSVVWVVAILFFPAFSFSQVGLSNLLKLTVVDSIQGPNSYGVLGFKSVHLKASGDTVYLAAKKIWHPDSTDMASIILGTRVNGHWTFRTVDTPGEKIFPSTVKLVLDEHAQPLIFFKDRTFENGWPKDGVINTIHFTNGQPVVHTAVTFKNNSAQGDRFNSFGSKSKPGFILLEQYWSDSQQKWYSEYSDYDDASGTLTPAATYNLDSLTNLYNSFTYPTPTADGNYFVHSCVIPLPPNYGGYRIGLLVYRRTEKNAWTLDFKFQGDTLSSGWPYLDVYGHVMGRAPDGSIYLLAMNTVGRPFFIKTTSGWKKITDNYPIASGVNTPGASGRPLDNEAIRFASDGTAFWGDIDGGPTYPFSAEISFRTPNDRWGRINCPVPPRFSANGGQFWHHDFVITQDDSLIILYEFAPSDSAFKKVYLMEAKASVRDIVDWVTSVKEKTSAPVPTEMVLLQNYPNPFNPSTTIQFSLPKSSHVTLRVYDALGHRVATLLDANKTAGKHTAIFEAKHLPSGIYFYTLKAGNIQKTGKMLLLR